MIQIIRCYAIYRYLSTPSIDCICHDLNVGVLVDSLIPDLLPGDYTEHQQSTIRSINQIYAQHKLQENKLSPLFDLCCSVVREHIERPIIRAEKYRQLNLPASIVRHLTREDIADQVYDEIVEHHENKDLIN